MTLSGVIEQSVRGTSVVFAADRVAGHDLSPFLSADESWRLLLAALAPVRGFLPDGIGDGVFHVTPKEVTQCVWALCAGCPSALARGQSPPEAVATTVVDLLLHGIGPGTAGGDDG